MGYFALALACVAAPCLLLPSPGMFVAAGVAIVAAATGISSYRRRAPGWDRLAGAAAAFAAATTLLVVTLKFALTAYAIDQLPSALL